MNVDGRGVVRGFCNFPGCSCLAYDGTASGGGKCDNCQHPPGRHANSSMTSVAPPLRTMSNVIPPASRYSSFTQQQPSLPRPVPRNAWDATPEPLPLLCAYPNCQDAPFFDLNTGENSVYCKIHMYNPPPPPMTTDWTLGAQFGHTMPISMHPSHHQGSSPHQLWTGFPPPRFFHISASSPNLQGPMIQPLALPPSSTPQPQLNQVTLLPDHERCKFPLCNRKRYKEADGRIYDFCGRYHAEEYKKLNGGEASIAPEMKCTTQGCSKPRHAREDGNGYYNYCGKSCRDGNFRTTPAAPGETCNLPGCNRPKYVDPANGRVHDYCGRTHANQAVAKGVVPKVCTIQQLSSSELSQVQLHFSSQWCPKKGTCPTITCAFRITNQQLEARWNAYKQQRLPSDSQSVEKYYHGTKLKCDIVNTQSLCSDEDCGICGICKFGMDRRCIRKNINFQRFGHGFYFASNSSKCHDYTQGVQTHRAMLLVEILPGMKHVIDINNVQLDKPPNGYHSVYGKTGKALNYPELVVYNPDCVMPRYIILYVHDGVHKIAK